MTAFNFVLEWRGDQVARDFQGRSLDLIEAAAKRSRPAILEAWRAVMPIRTGRMRASATLTVERTRDAVLLHFGVVVYYFYQRTTRRMVSQQRKLAIAIASRQLRLELGL